MKISASCLWLEKKFGYKKAFQMMKDAGFDAVDFGIDDWVGTEEEMKSSLCYRMSEEELCAYFTDVYETAKEIGLEITQTHALFGVDATRNHPALFEEITNKSIYVTHLLHCKHIVIHPVATPGRIYDENEEECFAFNLNFFRSFLPTLKKYGVKLAIEPMWTRNKEGVIAPTVCSRPEEILRYIDALGTDHYCSCPDIGHFVLVAKDTGTTAGGAIRKLGDTVEILHVHEVDGKNDNHTAPYTFPNTVDWADVLSALQDINYTGVLNFEVAGNFYNAYPEHMLPEALRHFAAIARDMANQIKGEMRK